MKKLGIIAGVVVAVVSVCFSIYVLGNYYLLKRDMKTQQIVLSNVVATVMNEVITKGEIILSQKDKDGKNVQMVLVEKTETESK